MVERRAVNTTWYAQVRQSCRTLGTPHQDDPVRLYADLVSVGVKPVLIRGKVDFPGTDVVRFTPQVWERIIANIPGLYVLLKGHEGKETQLVLWEEGK